jgi:hypothetical protein
MKRVEIDIEDVLKHYLPRVSEEQADKACEIVLNRIRSMRFQPGLSMAETADKLPDPKWPPKMHVAILLAVDQLQGQGRPFTPSDMSGCECKPDTKCKCDKQLTLLGHYVEAAANDDLATFNTSGFVAAPTRIPPQPLPPASIEWIDRGPTTGEIVVKVKSLPKAVSYDLQYALVANAGTPPTSWTLLSLPGSKKVTISNLTPAGKYAFQVRALGRLGYTNWSDPMMFICG